MIKKNVFVLFVLCGLTLTSCGDPELLDAILEIFESAADGDGDGDGDIDTAPAECDDPGPVVCSDVDDYDGLFSPTAVYRIASKKSEKSLDIGGQSTDNGANLSQWDYWGGANQKWLLKNKDENTYEIINLNSGKCLDVNGGSGDNGANILQWDCWGGDNQLWKVQQLDDASYEVRNLSSDKCIDLQDGNLENGGNIFQWDCWQSDNQKWIFEAVHEEGPDCTDYEQGIVVDLSDIEERLPLRTSGRYIVDKNGDRVKLVSVNWYGASDVYHVVGGLDKTTPPEIASLIKRMGFNSVRLPFSIEMISAPAVPEESISANPNLAGKSPLAIFDAVIEALTGEGLMVVLNNHTTRGGWCCGYDDNALWFDNEYSTEQWMRDWEFIVSRYEDNPLVIGADLRNEPRAGTSGEPRWGTDDAYDLQQAATVLGDRLHEINEDLLIIVEGLNYSQDLSDVAGQPVELAQPNKVVYSPHNYPFFRGENGPFDRVPYAYLKKDLDTAWGFILDEANKFTAPIWVSEFGIGIHDEAYGSKWFANFVRYLKENDIDWAWWPLNSGTKPGSEDTETWGLITEDWQAPLIDWRSEKIRSIQKTTEGPGVKLPCM